MPRYWPEALKGDANGIAVLLANLGTPAAPTAQALRPYLREFLLDPRVIEMPRALWRLILHGIILNTRPAKSAVKYAKIWMPEGSPLKVHTERQATLLQDALHHAKDTASVRVAWAMRYGAPSIAQTLNALRADGFGRILVVPLYPQYAASTTASVMDEVARCLRHWRNLPEIRYIRDFHTEPSYIAALARTIREHWATHGEPDRLLLSFHGLPQQCHDLGDPYPDECHATAKLLQTALELPDGRMLTCFQSRFGRAAWLQPYTQSTLEKLGEAGVARVDVVCPGFVADCLETLEEIGMECKAAFLASGGRDFHYIPCLNEHPDWIAALAALVRRNLRQWLEEPVSRPAI